MVLVSVSTPVNAACAGHIPGLLVAPKTFAKACVIHTTEADVSATHEN
jgi:hypothetical protein